MIDSAKYYRPIQYLGSKTRVVDSIVSECKRLYTPGDYVVDLFSGSTIVSQSLYRNGMNVIANDVLSFSSDIASCMLNQERRDTSIYLVECFIQRLRKISINSKYSKPFVNLIDREQVLLTNHNLVELKSLYENLSQVGNNITPTPQIEYIRKHYSLSAINNIPLFVNYYAGTYFGIKQSLEIDVLRNVIEEEWQLNNDFWEYKTLMTALYNTCSIIVHSAGKHFAQPIGIDDKNETKITNLRLFENRSHNVIEVFICCINNILKSVIADLSESKSFALNMDICTQEFKDTIKERKVSVIYADPPYTAQQYSRFYHIPEVLHSYVYPKLQVFRGEFTQGIYPEDKYKSPFCSKIRAVEAFESIFELARDNDSHLIVSYSESKKDKTGNERMVTMEKLHQLAKTLIPNYTARQITFDFDYRQLNNKGKIVEAKDDKEVLMIFEKK